MPGESGLTQLGWKSVGVLELTALPTIGQDRWEPWVRDADVLLVDGGEAFYLAQWMRDSGLAALLPSLEDTVWVGVSAGSMVMIPRVGDEIVDSRGPQSLVHWAQSSQYLLHCSCAQYSSMPTPTHACGDQSLAISAKQKRYLGRQMRPLKNREFATPDVDRAVVSVMWQEIGDSSALPAHLGRAGNAHTHHSLAIENPTETLQMTEIGRVST